MICWDRVNELLEEVGQDDFDEVLEIFFEEVEEVIEKLRNTPDPLNYEADFHFLRGSALNLGFEGFAHLCGDNEIAARNQKIDEINLAGVLNSYELSKHEFTLAGNVPTTL